MNNPGNWKERHFFNLNLNPSDKTMPDDPLSTLPNLATNPARYPDPEPGEAPTTPKDKEQPNVEGALPGSPAPAPTPDSTIAEGEPNPT